MQLLQELLKISQKTKKVDDVIRDHTGKALRGLAKQMAINRKRNNLKFIDSESEYHYGTAKVTRDLKEEEITSKTTEEAWSDGKSNSKTYIKVTPYYARKLDGGSKYEVVIDDGVERKPFSTLTRQELAKAFTPLRSNQTPDAEGFLQYQASDEIEAFKYSGDPVSLEINGDVQVIKKGDYLIQKVVGTRLEYEIKSSKDFEAVYKAK